MKTKLISLIKSFSPADITAVVLLTAAFIYLFVFSFFESTLVDEAFYVSIPYRLMNGDGLFTDEWHLSQLSAVLLYIPFRLFVFLTGGTEGIILFMRLLFSFMQLSVGAYIYKTFRSYGIKALIISLAFMFFSVIGLDTLSYNTMGIALLFVITCLSFSLTEKPSLIKMLLLGSFVAMFILCQPVGIIFYGIYFIAFCILSCKAIKTHSNTLYAFRPLSFLMTVAGILPILIFFLYLLFKNSDLATIIECIPGILTDVEHMEISDGTGIETFSLLAFFSDMTMAAGLVPIIITVICGITGILLKKQNKALSIVLTSSALIIFYLVFYIRLAMGGENNETDDINFFFFPLALSGIIFYLLADKKNHRVFILLWCTGILYAVFMTVSSNLALHSSTNGYMVSAAGTVILASDVLKELKAAEEKKALLKTAVVFLIISVFGFTALNTSATFIRSTAIRSSQNSSKLTDGIYKGISLPNHQALLYLRINKDTKEINEIISEDDKIFVLENIPSTYLEGNFNMGCISGWFIANQLGVSQIRDRFRSYYEINPHNIPDYIYVPAYAYSEEGLQETPPKMLAEFAYLLFEGDIQELSSGILIKVTGIKSE